MPLHLRIVKSGAVSFRPTITCPGPNSRQMRTASAACGGKTHPRRRRWNTRSSL